LSTKKSPKPVTCFPEIGPEVLEREAPIDRLERWLDLARAIEDEGCVGSSAARTGWRRHEEEKALRGASSSS
jgi:hypothetical protein